MALGLCESIPGLAPGSRWEGFLPVLIFHLGLSVTFNLLSIRGFLSGSSPHPSPPPSCRFRAPREGAAQARSHSADCHSPARVAMQQTCQGPSTTSPTSLKDFFTSTKECQCAMGFRGYASISFQWSRPRPSALIPTRQTPMISLWPTLGEKQRAWSWCLDMLPEREVQGSGILPGGANSEC